MKALALALALALAALLGGCATYTAALYGTGPASTDFVQCSKDNAGYGQIPDFGITYNKHFTKCMREAGWEQDPGKPKGPGWGPTAYRRVQPGPAPSGLLDGVTDGGGAVSAQPTVQPQPTPQVPAQAVQPQPVPVAPVVQVPTVQPDGSPLLTPVDRTRARLQQCGANPNSAYVSEDGRWRIKGYGNDVELREIVRCMGGRMN